MPVLSCYVEKYESLPVNKFTFWPSRRSFKSVRSILSHAISSRRGAKRMWFWSRAVVMTTQQDVLHRDRRTRNLGAHLDSPCVLHILCGSYKRGTWHSEWFGRWM